MKKLLLLVDRAYFEVYRDKYDKILEKAVLGLRKKFKDEVIPYDAYSSSLVAKQKQELDRNIDVQSNRDKMSVGGSTFNLGSGGVTMTIDRRRGNLTEKMDRVTVSNGIKLDDNLSEDLENVVRNRENSSSHKRFRSYNKLDKSNALKYVIIICLSTLMLVFPGLLDYFLKTARLNNLRLLESAAYKADRVCTAALSTQSLF